jgi:hypothetical protein
MTLARCAEPGCPVRYRNGGDRLCALHAQDGGDTLASRMQAFEALSAIPGAQDGDPGAHDGDPGRSGR